MYRSFPCAFCNTKQSNTLDALTLYHTIQLLTTLRAFENIVGRGENADNQHFSHNVFYPSQNKFNFSLAFILSAANAVVWHRVNPFPNKPWFSRVCNTSMLKTLWEKEKFEIVVCKSVKLVFGEGLIYEHSLYNQI